MRRIYKSRYFVLRKTEKKIQKNIFKTGLLFEVIKLNYNKEFQN